MPSIPYEVALENQKKLRDHSDNQENLTQQVSVPSLSFEIHDWKYLVSNLNA